MIPWLWLTCEKLFSHQTLCPFFLGVALLLLSKGTDDDKDEDDDDINITNYY